MIVAGVGCRRGTSADEIERVVRLALGMHELPAERLQAIATESEKATEPAFPEVARRLSVELVACTVMDLDRVAGRNARLLGARVATERATCAIATGEGR
jgi:cobalt-precorrin 5A hydrolase